MGKILDSLGDRMKEFYENRFRFFLPRRTYTLIRIDGKAFHTYTQGLKRPFDEGLIEDMNLTAAHLCKEIQGAKLAYVQSDEISVILTDFDDIKTDAWFDHNLQKMCSVAASIATAKFNQLRLIRACDDSGGDFRNSMIDDYTIEKFRLAMFDARVFQISNREEVINYLIWRQQDATRNSIASVAQSLYSHNELNGKNSGEQQELIFQKGINWNDFSSREKRGGVVKKVQTTWALKIDKETQKPIGVAFEYKVPEEGYVLGLDHKLFNRSEFSTVETPIFSQDKDFLKNIIP